MSAALPLIRRYRILGSIGRGGMGEVFLAEDETLERRVAIKRIAAPLAAEGAARSRFLREARAMAGIEHPHVVRVYAFGEAEGQPYIVMEYVEGETLAVRLTRATRLAVEDALRIAREVTQALAAAWTRGIVHRDVKPANILLDREDHVKVADFGLARPPRGEDSEATGSGSVVGTPHHISPEQARGEETGRLLARDRAVRDARWAETVHGREPGGCAGPAPRGSAPADPRHLSRRASWCGDAR